MTSNEFRDLAEQLAALAEEPAPPAALDTAWALRKGRARLRRRRGAVVGAVAAATAVVLAGTSLLQPGGGAAAPAVLPPPTVTASPAPSATPTRAGVDPLTTEVRFGWLPDWVGGQSGVGYHTGYHGIFAQALGRGENAPRIILTLYPAGPEPEAEGFSGRPEKTPAPPVNGQPAFWLTDSDPTTHVNDRLLRWQTPSGRWAQIRAYGGRPADIADDVLVRVANGAEYGKWNVPLPVRFAPLPEVFKASDVSLSKPSPLGGAWDLWLMFQFEGKNVSVTMEPDGRVPSAFPTGTDGATYTDPNAPTCQVKNGVKVCVGVGMGIAPSLEQIGGLEGLLARTEALGVDESRWTTDVLN
ncbi:hypothetical protein ACFVHB_33115 [Kitasatospora sp. NPDC127111]|uniref:hypothetical protein n=1 Tax=Kitasatospora sp. NPDC127111 TaxID=3345363 RepID=UPI00362D4AEA